MSPEILLVSTVLFTIGTSFFCSVLEASLLSVNITTVMDMQEKGSRGAALLLQLKRERIEDAISSILSLNTVANTIGSTFAGYLAAAIWSEVWVGIFTAAFVFAILVFSEIIPKTIGAIYGQRLVPFVGYTVNFLTVGMYPFVVISRSITRRISRRDEQTVTRGDISALVSLAADEGAITSHLSYIFSSLLDSDKISLADVMTPRSVIAMMPADATVDDLAGSEEVRSFSRVPIYDENPDDVIGYVIVRQVLARGLREGKGDMKLSVLKRQATMLPKSYSVGDGLRALVRKREHMAFVLDEYGSLRGLVTLEDLIETILGIEIIDESDRVVDMRAVAMRIRDQRLAKIESKISEQAGELD